MIFNNDIYIRHNFSTTQYCYVSVLLEFELHLLVLPKNESIELKKFLAQENRMILRISESVSDFYERQGVAYKKKILHS